jgi:hypothetical protein
MRCVVSFTPCTFNPQRKSPGTNWTGNRRLGGRRYSLYILEKRYISYTCWEMKYSSLDIQPIAQFVYQLSHPPLIKIHFDSVTSICVYNIQITTITRDARSPNKIHLENMYTPIYNRLFQYCCMKYLVCWQFWTSSTLVSSMSPVKLYNGYRWEHKTFIFSDTICSPTALFLKSTKVSACGALKIQCCHSLLQLMVLIHLNFQGCHCDTEARGNHSWQL